MWLDLACSTFKDYVSVFNELLFKFALHRLADFLLSSDWLDSEHEMSPSASPMYDILKYSLGRLCPSMKDQMHHRNV